MSDSFEMLVDVDATLDEADGLQRAVIDRFRTLGLITGELDPDCVLGGRGYHPGPAIPQFYDRDEREGAFWELRTCGVEPQVRRSYNFWALGPACEGLTCPACRTTVKPLNDEFGDAVGEALGEWDNESGPALLTCPQCSQSQTITEWQCHPPLGFGNLSFRFWNWPPLDLPSWKIDIAGIVREVTGHRIEATHGHL